MNDVSPLGGMTEDERNEMLDTLSEAIIGIIPENIEYILLLTPSLNVCGPEDAATVLLATSLPPMAAISVMKTFGDEMEQEIIEAN